MRYRPEQIWHNGAFSQDVAKGQQEQLLPFRGYDLERQLARAGANSPERAPLCMPGLCPSVENFDVRSLNANAPGLV